MQTITLKVNDTIYDKFQWLLNHFSQEEVHIVNEIDAVKFPINSFEYISSENMDLLKNFSDDYKKGNRDDFEEYTLR